MKLSYEEREQARLTMLSLVEITPDDARYIIMNGVDVMAQYNFSDGHKLRKALQRRAKGYWGPEVLNDMELLDMAGKIATRAGKIAFAAGDEKSEQSINGLLSVMSECHRRTMLGASNLMW